MFGCNKEYRNIKGRVFYIESNKIIEFDLQSRNKKIIYEGEEAVLFNFLNYVDENLFILEVSHITEGDSIQYLNTSKRNLEFIIEGRKPLYIASEKVLFYCDLNGNLYQMILNNKEEGELVASDVHRDSKSPIRISDEEVVYYTKDNKIAIYNFKKKEVETLNITRYLPLHYYKKRNALLCSYLEDEKLYFVGLNNQDVEKLDIKIRWGIYGHHDYIIVDEYDCLIYSKTKLFPPMYEDMYIYWIDDKKEQKYLRDTKIVSGIYKKD
jgi:hypothetical protein